jgi:predicted nuclease of restriction endonuclease-like RecB superfamily
MEKYREDGILLSPKSVKRDIHNVAKKLNITVAEAAECSKLIYKTLYEETLQEIKTIELGQV